MAYKFIGRIKKIGIDPTGNFCEFSVDNNIKIDGKQSQMIPIVYSDSAYCVNTLNEWVFGWAKNGWIKSDKKTPENLKLIKVYYEWYQKGYRINLKKIKGHAGHEFHELADELATGKIIKI